MTELQAALRLTRARWVLATARGGERGASAVDWLLIVIGTVAIAGIAIAAVKTYVSSQTSKLNK